MANEMAHVNQYVLLSNEDDRFSSVKATKDKKGNYTPKKGRDFWSAKDDNGNTTAFGYKSGMDSCTDGAPSKGDDPDWQPSTSYSAGGQTFNGRIDPFVVLPRVQDGVTKKGQPIWKSPVNVPGNPFHDMGLKGGDCVRVTDPKTGKSVYGLYAENGPAGQVGENSVALNHALGEGVNSDGSFAKTQNTGFPMTDDRYLQNEFYPGSAARTPSGSLQKMSFAEIQKHCAAAAANASPRGGVPIVTGQKSVLVGVNMEPAANADPFTTMHLGDCPMLTGSDSVSIALRPSTRVGDDCNCGMNVVAGATNVWVYGAKTTASSTLDPATTSLLDMPDWAKGATQPLGDPLAPFTSPAPKK